MSSEMVWEHANDVDITQLIAAMPSERANLDEEEWWIETFGGHRHYHRPLGRYVEWIASLRLGLVELYEPSPGAYEDWRSRIPTRLGMAARRIES